MDSCDEFVMVDAASQSLSCAEESQSCTSEGYVEVDFAALREAVTAFSTTPCPSEAPMSETPEVQSLVSGPSAVPATQVAEVSAANADEDPMAADIRALSSAIASYVPAVFRASVGFLRRATDALDIERDEEAASTTRGGDLEAVAIASRLGHDEDFIRRLTKKRADASKVIASTAKCSEFSTDRHWRHVASSPMM